MEKACVWVVKFQREIAHRHPATFQLFEQELAYFPKTLNLTVKLEFTMNKIELPSLTRSKTLHDFTFEKERSG